LQFVAILNGWTIFREWSVSFVDGFVEIEVPVSL